MEPSEKPKNPLEHHIQQLTDEEYALYEQSTLSDTDRARLRDIQVDLDQCWDLLRQRRARGEMGESPEDTQLRPPEVVENYQG